MDVNELLIRLADKLDQEGKSVCASAVDDLIKTSSLQKVAQYVGAIGYVLKQNRAMSNCVRKKRVDSNGPMQEIVLDCLKEYQDGQDYHNTEWTSKYAQVISEVPESFENAHLHYLKDLAESNDIQTHIDKVAETSEILHNNHEYVSSIDDVLVSLYSLNNVIEKEAGSTKFPFRLAAPQRSWWDRVKTPTNFSLMNPFSWDKKRRERGRFDEKEQAAMEEDQETSSDMFHVNDIIGDIQDTAAELQHHVQTLKTESSIYNLDPKVSNAIEQINPSMWQSVNHFGQQLTKFMSESDEEPRISHKDFLKGFKESEEKFSKLLPQLKNKMSALRQRSAIQGKWQADQRASSSLYKELITLKQAVGRIIQNPLDSKATWFAEEAHGRLFDALRHVPSSPEDEFGNRFQQWHEQGPERYQPVPGPAAGEARPQSNVMVDLENNPSIQQAAQQFSKLDPGTTQPLLDILLIMAQQNPEWSPLTDMLSTLINKTDESQEQINTAQEPDLEQQYTEPVQQNTGPPVQQDPTGQDVFDPSQFIPDDEDVENIDHWNDFPEWDEDDAEEEKGKLMPIQASSRVETMIKMADILDGVDSRLGDFMDKHIETYIKEYINQVEEKAEDHKFPDFGEVIIEEASES